VLAWGVGCQEVALDLRVVSSEGKLHEVATGDMGAESSRQEFVAFFLEPLVHILNQLAFDLARCRTVLELQCVVVDLVTILTRHRVPLTEALSHELSARDNARAVDAVVVQVLEIRDEVLLRRLTGDDCRCDAAWRQEPMLRSHTDVSDADEFFTATHTQVAEVWGEPQQDKLDRDAVVVCINDCGFRIYVGLPAASL